MTKAEQARGRETGGRRMCVQEWQRERQIWRECDCSYTGDKRRQRWITKADAGVSDEHSSSKCKMQKTGAFMRVCGSACRYVCSSLTWLHPCAAARASWGAASSPWRPCGRCSPYRRPGWRPQRCPGWLLWTERRAPAWTESPRCALPAGRNPAGCTCTTPESFIHLFFPTSTSSSSCLSSPLLSVLHVIREGIVAQQQFHSIQVAIVAWPVESGPPLRTHERRALIQTVAKKNSGTDVRVQEHIFTSLSCMFGSALFSMRTAMQVM